jgi:16S rRNA (cytidine1402-2'-O)-methyltransferase
MGQLYVVSTPIGNLEDITLRALRSLREAALIVAEDTRHTRKLLQHYQIETPCMSYHEHNKLLRRDAILAALDQGDVALVSDAGTPALSDPGYDLVVACIEAGHTVTPVPGPSAPMAALVASGLATTSFYYVGFLPRRSRERQAALRSLAPLDTTLICFEAPHRLVATLSDALEVLGDRPIVLARELTKLHEEWLRTSIGAAQRHFAQQRPRGEFTLVIAGSSSQPPPDQPAAEEERSALLRQKLREQRAAGQRGSAAVRAVAQELGVPRRAVYQLWLELNAEEHPDS